jgi:hypothetical protein
VLLLDWFTSGRASGQFVLDGSKDVDQRQQLQVLSHTSIPLMHSPLLLPRAIIIKFDLG